MKNETTLLKTCFTQKFLRVDKKTERIVFIFTRVLLWNAKLLNTADFTIQHFAKIAFTMERKTELNTLDLTIPNISDPGTTNPPQCQTDQNKSSPFITINGVRKYIFPENLKTSVEGKSQKRRKSAPDPGGSEEQAGQGTKRIHETNSLDEKETLSCHKRIKEEWQISQPSEMSKENPKLAKKDHNIITPTNHSIGKSLAPPTFLDTYSLSPQKDKSLHLLSLKDKTLNLPSSTTNKNVHLSSPFKHKITNLLSPPKANPVHPPGQLFNKPVLSPNPKKDKPVQSTHHKFPLDNLFKENRVISDMVGTVQWIEYKSNLNLNKVKRRRKGVNKFLYFSETGNWQRLNLGSFKGDMMEVQCPLKFNFIKKEKLKKSKKCLWNAKCILCNEDEVSPRMLNIRRKSTYFSEYGLETSTDKLNYMSTNMAAGITAHLNCLIYSSAPGMMQDFVKMATAPENFIDGFPIEEVKVQVNMAEKSKCSYCGKRGAASQCSKKSCTQTGWYHFPCGLRNGSWQDGKGRTFCSRHIPYQIEKRSSGNKIKLRRPRKTICGSQETPPSSQESSVSMSQNTREYFSSRSAEDARLQMMAAKGNTVLHIGLNFKEELDNAFNRLTPISALDILYQMEVDNGRLYQMEVDNIKEQTASDATPVDLEDEDVVRLSTVVRREYGGKKFIFKTREFSESPTGSDSNPRGSREVQGSESGSRQLEQSNPPLDDSVANNEILMEPAKSIGSIGAISTSMFLIKHCLNEVIDDEPPVSPPSSPGLRDNNEPVSSPRSKSSDFAAFHNDIVDINLVSNNEIMESHVVPPTCRIIHPAFPEENDVELSNDIVEDKAAIIPENNQITDHMECRMENDNLKAEIQQLKGLLMKKEQKIDSMKKENNRLVEENRRKENGWQKQLLSHMQENRNLREQLKTARVENVDLKEQREMKKRAIQHFADQLRNGVDGLEEINCSNSANLDSNADRSDREPISDEAGIKIELAD